MKTYVVGQVPTGYAPLPPENVLINGARYPADISGAYTISWAPNPREHFHGPAVSGPETYTLRLYDETNTLRHIETGLTSTSYTWSTEGGDSGLGTGEDAFATDTTAQYTQYADTAGTWSVCGGELVATGGNNSAFIRNVTSFTDVTIEADINYIYDGGLVLRFIDVNNYYLLRLCDDSGTVPNINFRIYKRVAGTLSLLTGNIDITWARGTSKTIRFSASGSTFKAYLNGAQITSVSDSSITGPGGVGMWNETAGQQSKYQAFRWNVQTGSRLNTSVRAELETVRGGVTSYQKQVIKTLRSVTTV